MERFELSSPGNVVRCRRPRIPFGRQAGTMVLGALLAVFAGCAVEPVPVVLDPTLTAPRYLRYTLRGQQEGFYTQAHRSNYLSFPAVYKPGSEVKIVLYSDVRLDLTIGGLPCRMFTRDTPFPIGSAAAIQEFLDKHFAASKEEVNLEALEPGVRSLVEQGKEAITMTKEQVLMALGYPSHIDSYVIADSLPRQRVLESNQWIYRVNEIAFVTTYRTCQFDSEGKLAKVIQ